jgi:hypothetical protein
MPERRGDLSLGDRGCDRVELGVGEIPQIAHRRGAVPRQHVERISEVTPSVLGRILGGADEIAQAVEREPEGDVRHRKPTLARARQEVGDVGVEPHVIAARGPQPERAIRALTCKQPLDRIADALIDGGVECKLRRARKIVDIQQRQRATGDLLGASERIAIERRQQRRRIERGRDADRQGDASAPGTRSANRSFERRRLSPLASGLTVRRARICVAGRTASA